MDACLFLCVCVCEVFLSRCIASGLSKGSLGRERGRGTEWREERGGGLNTNI